MSNPATDREFLAGTVTYPNPPPHHFLAMAPPCEVEQDKTPQNLETAAVALEYYNKKHHTDYELVEALDSTGFLSREIWYHTSFTAKPKTVPHKGDSSPKLFFAEYMFQHPRHCVVHCCRILDGRKTAIGCEHCKSLVHPTYGFRKGLYRYQHRVLRPRTICGRRVRSSSGMSKFVNTSSCVDTSSNSKKSRLG